MICQFIFEEQSFDDITSDQSQKEGIIEWYKMMEHIEEITFKEQSELPMETTTIRKKPITIFKKLTSISFPITLSSVEEKAFEHLIIKEVNCLPKWITCFRDRKEELKTITFGNSTTDIIGKIFKSFSYLNTFIIPENVTSIEPNL